MSAARIVLMVAAAAVAAPAPADAQDATRREIRESQERLEQIRREREQLQREMESLQTRVRDVASELANIERQRETSAAALRELDFQTAALASGVAEITRELLLSRDRFRHRTVLLHHRLRSIYKRGPMHAVRVLLGAESFGELLNRYKYLHLLALHDRKLLDEVSRLESNLVEQDRALQRSIAQLQRLRAEKLDEFAQLQYVESRHEETLREFRQREQQARGRIAQLTRDEVRLTSVIADLERRRLEEERRRAVAGVGAATEGSITTRDLGSLNWPVDGRVVYRFGPERRPNGVVLRRNGIGIAGETGATVRAVESGNVMMARPFEGYGPTVLISHGNGYYTSYHYLGSIAVREGERIEAGHPIGTLGGERTAEGPHIEFQVRAPVQGGVPEPVDPLGWLRSRPTR